MRWGVRRGDRSPHDDDTEHPATARHRGPRRSPVAAGGVGGRRPLPRPVGRRSLPGGRAAVAGHRGPAADALSLLLPRAARRPGGTPRPDRHLLRRLRRRDRPAVARHCPARGADRPPQPRTGRLGRDLRRPRAVRPDLPRRGGPPRPPTRRPRRRAGRLPVRRGGVRRLPRLQRPQPRDHGRLAAPRHRRLAGSDTRPGTRARPRGHRRAAARRTQGHHPAVRRGRRGTLPRPRPARHHRAARRAGPPPRHTRYAKPPRGGGRQRRRASAGWMRAARHAG